MMDSVELTVKKAIVEVQVLTVNNRQVTQAFVRQIDYWYLCTGSISKWVIPAIHGEEVPEYRQWKLIGRIQYFPDLKRRKDAPADEDDYCHIVFSVNGNLYRSYILLDDIGQCYGGLEQIYIAV